ncbi:3'-5' exonuclease [Oceanidesulfovibrio marinus]|uniref:3'-5' exonuclease n=1 Tax=Oceanidesulfovibrio marinus TaxID=370038 RepID=A0ABX6NDH8_9BACT|nr:3'-5' exonuclease [Oceanidesulfovibrio marinus]QJT08654.1 3'-5' exonuclease [Oceanidesulfovibrio marinus]
MIRNQTLPERFAKFMGGLLAPSPSNQLLARNHECFREIDQHKPLEEYEFAVVDTELTGLDVRRDEIVSIGGVRIRSMELDPSDTFSAIVRPHGDLPKTSTLIHRITPQQVRDRPLLEDVLPDFVVWLGTSFMVGHHVGLDMRFLNRACRKALGAALKNPGVDTMRLAQVYEAELWESYYDRYDLNISYHLNDLTTRYGLPAFGRHDALQDALQTAYLFLFLVRKLRQGGIHTLHDLYLAGRSWRWYL